MKGPGVSGVTGGAAVTNIGHALHKCDVCERKKKVCDEQSKEKQKHLKFWSLDQNGPYITSPRKTLTLKHGGGRSMLWES